MKILSASTRIKLGRFVRISPAIQKRLKLAVGDQVECQLTKDGGLEITKALTSAQQRVKRLRVRLRKTMTARAFERHVTVYQGADGLSVLLLTGETLTRTNAEALALELHQRGYSVDHVHVADWREGDRSPGAGQSIALKRRLMQLERGNG